MTDFIHLFILSIESICLYQTAIKNTRMYDAGIFFHPINGGCCYFYYLRARRTGFLATAFLATVARVAGLAATLAWLAKP